MGERQMLPEHTKQILKVTVPSSHPRVLGGNLGRARCAGPRGPRGRPTLGR